MSANDHNSVDDLALKCVRCGFCLDACPTFRLTSNEAASPRGRIYLMRSVADGTAPLDADVLGHLDSCLGCRACETACPSGVEYSSLLERFRSVAEVSDARSASQRFARRQLLNMLTNPDRLALALRLSRFMPGGGHSLPGPAADLLTGGADASVVLPSAPAHVRVGSLPGFSPSIGPRRFTVGVLEGCAMRVLYPHVNEATVRVLQRAGCDVVAPRSAGCCGALHVHAGYPVEARSRARALIDAFGSVELDALVVNSAGCGSTLKDYGALLTDDPVYAARARGLAGRVRDVSEFLAQAGLPAATTEVPLVVAYHDACHLAHGQGITSAPRELLQSIPGLTLVDLEESDTCCGSAGIYNLVQPALAQELLERKLQHIVATGASVVAAGNPGCLAWIEQGLRDHRLPVQVMHPIELIDRSLQA